MSANIINNSFSITQAKKLIGIGYLNSQNSNNSLWLPTKLSKLNTVETSKQVNNLPNFFRNVLLPESSNFIKYSNLTNPNFTNLNYFENSRLYVFKKYFFMNQISNNNIILDPIINDLFNDYSYVMDRSLLFSKTHKSVGYNYLSIYDNLYSNLSISLHGLRSLQYGNKYNIQQTKLNTDFINLNINNLDILTNSNTNFLLLLTSNIQNNTVVKYFQL